jgi:hypothetical protein
MTNTVRLKRRATLAQLLDEAREDYPDASHAILILFEEGNNGRMSTLHMNTTAQQLAIASVRLAKLADED